MSLRSLRQQIKKSPAAGDPAAYLQLLDGWQRTLVEQLRTAVTQAADLEEVVKWGHLVYLSNGPVLLIRAEEDRVLFGFWRGLALRHLEPRLKRGGKYEMATLALRPGDTIAPEVIRRLTVEAVDLNASRGNPAQIDRRPGG